LRVLSPHSVRHLVGLVREIANQSGRLPYFLLDLTVNMAGHMVPLNKPKESLQMFNNWIAGKSQ
jgi:carboxypeptidase C (cathepsin A)